MYGDSEKTAITPLVSITIPSFNAAKTLLSAIESVLEQSYSNIEIIVVDDGSTDETKMILEKFYKRIKCVYQENSGLAAARNAAFQVARGQYIAMMDADDLCKPERIAVQVAYMEANPEIVMCSSDFSAFNETGILAESFIESYYSQIRKTKGGLSGIYSEKQFLSLDGKETVTYSGYVYEHIAFGSFIHPPTVLFRSEILHKSGFLDESIPNCCDPEWFVRVCRLGKVGYIDKSLLNYRFSATQMSGRQNRIQISADIIRVLEKTLNADPDLYKLNRRKCRLYLADAYLYAADSLADHFALPALNKLARSISLGTFRRQSLEIFIKAFLPYRILQWQRSGGKLARRSDRALP